MKLISANILLTLSLFLVSSPLMAETALEIAKKHDLKKIAALTAYLKADVDDEEHDLALGILVDASMDLGELAPVPDLLAQRYDLQNKGPEADLQLIVTKIIRPFIESASATNQRDKAKAFVARVKEDFSSNPQSAQLNQFVDQLSSELYRPGVGDTMNFSFTDLSGNEVDLSKMQDKVILVDFWATWCGPCVAEMPKVIEVYNSYHKKGFDVIGISLDEDKGALEEFIKSNKMPWPQYYDGKGWANDLAKQYGIGSIPATFLIGKDGKVVASNLRGEALEKAVADSLKGE